MVEQSIVTDALDNLRVHQRKLDADGCEVGVSRQALNDVIIYVGRLMGELAALKHDIERQVEVNAELATENERLREALSRTGAVVAELSGDTGELIDRMAAAIRDWGSHYDDGPWETLPEDRKAGWRGDARRALAVVKEYLTARLPGKPAATCNESLQVAPEARQDDEPVAHAYVVNGECEQIEWGVDIDLPDDPALVLLYTRPAEQAVTEAMVEAAAISLRPDLFTPLDPADLQSDDFAWTRREEAKANALHKARSALEAAMEADHG